MRFSWKALRVQDEIAALSGQDSERAEAAYEYLMLNKKSAYHIYIREHEEWLRHGNSSENWQMNRICDKHLECAVWPDLYNFASWCDSNFAGKEETIRSPKASFLVKAFSSIVDYGCDYELLQFHYDRWIWSKFTARSAVAKGIALKYALKDICETPFASYLNHMKLVDIHRQLGPAHYWITVAPGIYAMPLHDWIEEP